MVIEALEVEDIPLKLLLGDLHLLILLLVLGLVLLKLVALVIASSC